MNSYKLFVERAINLLKDQDYLGFIVPNTWLSDNDSTLLRKLILTKTKIIKVLVLPESLRVFAGVTQATTVIILQKETNIEMVKKNMIIFLDEVTEKRNFDEFITGEIKQETFHHFEDYKILTKESVLNVITKIQKSGNERLSKYFNINQGEVNLTVYKEYLRNSEEPNSRILIRGNNIGRYSLDFTNSHKEGFIVFSNLKKDNSDKKRIILQEVSNMANKRRLKVVLLDFEANLGHTCNYLYFIDQSKTKNDLLYFLALLNSKLLDFYFMTFSNTNHVSGKELKSLPIKVGSRTQQQLLIDLTGRMLSQNKRLKEFGEKITDVRRKIEDEIKKIDCEIDELIYKIYGLTDPEKEIIEKRFN